MSVIRFKLDFFDTERVMKKVDAATRRALSRVGAFVRTRARTSIRKRKDVSQPGQPPSSHEGSLRRLIFFAYDQSAKSVVIGPVPFRKGEAPSLLERGGTVGRKGRAHRYRPRPFMAPALAAEAKQIPAAFKGVLGG